MKINRLLFFSILFSLSLSVFSQKNAPIFSVSGEKVYTDEFERALAQVPGMPRQDFMRKYLEMKLKVRSARKAGLDHDKALLAEISYLISQSPYRQALSRVGGNERLVDIVYFTAPLPQNMDDYSEHRVMKYMAGLRDELQKEENLVRRADELDGAMAAGVRLKCGRTGPVRNSVLLDEWQEMIGKSADSLSMPFYSPVGIHILKFISDISREQLQRQEELFEIEVSDEVLAAAYDKRASKSDRQPTDRELKKFFKQHKSDYAWELPRFRGAVILGKTKKVAKALRKILKKHPFSEWDEIVSKHLSDDQYNLIKADCGLFPIGTNQYVDREAFKCGNIEADKEYPYHKVLGKVLKNGPESIYEIYDRLASDYVKAKEEAHIEKLMKEFEVVIY